MRVAAALAILVVAGCSFDWDGFDPRLARAVGGAGGASSGPGGAAVGGAGGAGGACGAGTEACAGSCVDFATDPDHCGDCTTACGPEQVCSLGSCQSAPNCQVLHLARPALGDGSYTIAPAGVSTPFVAHCDMTTEGGGWTMVASVADRSYFNGTSCDTLCDPDPATTCDESPFTDASAVGDVADMLVADHKSAAYSSVAFGEMLFVDSNGHYVSYDVAGGSVAAWYPAGLENWVPAGTEAHSSYSYAAKASDLDATDNPCGTLRVSFNVEDSDSQIGNTCHSTEKGPVWSNVNNSSCFWDDGGIPWTKGAFFDGNTTDYRLWLVR